MQTFKLKHKQLASLDLGKHADGHGLGFLVRKYFTPDSEERISRSWFLRYQFGGKERMMGLGTFPEIGLATARQMAEQIRAKMTTDPLYDPIAVAEHATAKQKEIAEQRDRTFGSVFESWFEHTVPDWHSKVTAEKVKSQVTKYCKPIWSRPVTEIDDADVIKVLTPIWKAKNVMARALRGNIEAILNYAVAMKWRSPGDNPARWRGHLQFRLPKHKHKVRHHPSIPYLQMPAFFAALRDHKQTDAAKALAMLTLTALRLDDVLQMTPEMVSFDLNTITIPETKEIEGFVLPMVPQMVELLRPLVEATAPGERLFKIEADALRELIDKLSPVKAVPHGLRASFKTYAEDISHAEDKVIEVCLGHVLGDGTERAYMRGQYLTKRTILMKQWADYLEKPVQTATVTGIDRVRRSA